jgi:hypothetical protein
MFQLIYYINYIYINWYPRLSFPGLLFFGLRTCSSNSFIVIGVMNVDRKEQKSNILLVGFVYFKNEMIPKSRLMNASYVYFSKYTAVD